MTHILGLQLHGATLSLPARHRRTALSILTRLQSASAGVLAAFGVVHLSAPLMGLLHLGTGDVNERVDAVSRWMLLGRVAYQSGLGEGAVWAALGVHLVAGAVKRVILRFTVARPAAAANTDAVVEKEKVVSRARAKLTVAQASGWLLCPLALHHAFVNRIVPSSPAAPIARLSPAELDYSFVAHSLSHPNTGVRVLMSAAYVLLVGAFAVHTAYAVPALFRSLPRQNREAGGKVSRGKKRSKGRVAAGLAGVLLASVVSIVPFGERLHISGTLKDRYDAVLRATWPTRFFLSS